MNTRWQHVRIGVGFALQLVSLQTYSCGQPMLALSAQHTRIHTCTHSLKSGNMSPSDALLMPPSKRSRENVCHDGPVRIFMVTWGKFEQLPCGVGVQTRYRSRVGHSIASWRSINIQGSGSVQPHPLQTQELKIEEGSKNAKTSNRNRASPVVK